MGVARQNSSIRKSVSIAEVAAAANVSVTTVSHVVSGNRPVSAATTARVQRTMKQLGYVPNHAAKSLRSGSTRIIGLLIPDISNPYFAELAKGVEDAAEEFGFGVVICSTQFDRKREARYLDVLRGGAIDGMIYAAGAPPSGGRLAQMARAFPMAIADEELVDVRATTVVSDNRRGGELVGEHLRELGHRAALYISGPIALATSHRRLEGFRRGFADGRIELRLGDYREGSGVRAVQEELAEGGRWFTAIFAGNDLMALGALRSLAAAGLSVPGDMSIVGYDDIALASLVRPALTSVRQPVYGIGHAAAQQLISGLRRGDMRPITRLELEVQLIERETTGVPARVAA